MARLLSARSSPEHIRPCPSLPAVRRNLTQPPGGLASASSISNSTYNAGNTNTVNMTNTFNVPSSATADNVTSYLAFSLEHLGLV
jgi:hypothetical protein